MALMYKLALLHHHLERPGVAFAAVQRLRDARWSRPVVRSSRGYVAWLPVAFVILLVILFLGAHTLFQWGHEELHAHQKAVYLDPTFFRMRGDRAVRADDRLHVLVRLPDVRLDVGVIARAGARLGGRAPRRMRAGFGDERRELHTTHSLLGQAGRRRLPAVRVGLDPLMAGTTR
jgi:hypothetical protein